GRDALLPFHAYPLQLGIQPTSSPSTMISDASPSSTSSPSVSADPERRSVSAPSIPSHSCNHSSTCDCSSVSGSIIVVFRERVFDFGSEFWKTIRELAHHARKPHDVDVHASERTKENVP